VELVAAQLLFVLIGLVWRGYLNGYEDRRWNPDSYLATPVTEHIPRYSYRNEDVKDVNGS